MNGCTRGIAVTPFGLVEHVGCLCCGLVPLVWFELFCLVSSTLMGMGIGHVLWVQAESISMDAAVVPVITCQMNCNTCTHGPTLTHMFVICAYYARYTPTCPGHQPLSHYDICVQLTWGLSRMRYEASEEWVEWLVSELQLRYADISKAPTSAQESSSSAGQVPGPGPATRQQLVDLVTTVDALAQLAPTSSVALEWVQAVVNDHLHGQVRRMSPAMLVSLIWSCARMGKFWRALAWAEGRMAGTAERVAESDSGSVAPGASGRDISAGGHTQQTQSRTEEHSADVPKHTTDSKPSSNHSSSNGVSTSTNNGVSASNGSSAATWEVLSAWDDVTTEVAATGPQTMGRFAAPAAGSIEPATPAKRRSGQKKGRRQLQLSQASATALLSACYSQMPMLSRAHLSRMVYAVSMLGLKPSQQWVGRLLACVNDSMGSMSHFELVSVMYALGQMQGSKLPAAWVDGCMEQVGTAAEGDMVMASHSACIPYWVAQRQLRADSVMNGHHGCWLQLVVPCKAPALCQSHACPLIPSMLYLMLCRACTEHAHEGHNIRQLHMALSYTNTLHLPSILPPEHATTSICTIRHIHVTNSAAALATPSRHRSPTALPSWCPAWCQPHCWPCQTWSGPRSMRNGWSTM